MIDALPLSRRLFTIFLLWILDCFIPWIRFIGLFELLMYIIKCAYCNLLNEMPDEGCCTKTSNKKMQYLSFDVFTLDKYKYD